MSRRAAVGFTLALPPVILIALFVGLPMVLAIGLSLGFTGGLNQTIAEIGVGTHDAQDWWGTSAVYRDLLADPRFPRDLAATVVVTVVATAAVVAISVALSLYLRLTRSRLANFLAALAVVPLFIPVVIASWAILDFYAQEGFVRSLFAQFGLTGPTWGFTTTGVVLGSIWVNLPFATLLTASGIQGVPDALIEVARDAGAGTARIITRVILPLARIPLIIAATFTAIGILGQFTVPYFIGPSAPKMLGVDIANYFQGFDKPQQSVAIAVVIFLLASVVAAFYVWANFRSSADSEGRR